MKDSQVRPKDVGCQQPHQAGRRASGRHSDGDRSPDEDAGAGISDARARASRSGGGGQKA